MDKKQVTRCHPFNRLLACLNEGVQSIFSPLFLATSFCDGYHQMARAAQTNETAHERRAPVFTSARESLWHDRKHRFAVMRDQKGGAVSAQTVPVGGSAPSIRYSPSY